MITHILVKPIDTLVEPIVGGVGGLDPLRVLKINISTFFFLLKFKKKKKHLSCVN